LASLPATFISANNISLGERSFAVQEICEAPEVNLLIGVSVANGIPTSASFEAFNGIVHLIDLVWAKSIWKATLKVGL
jgi:hypothetical protein